MSLNDRQLGRLRAAMEAAARCEAALTLCADHLARTGPAVDDADVEAALGHVREATRLIEQVLSRP